MLSKLPDELQDLVYNMIDYESVHNKFISSLQEQLYPDLYFFVYNKLPNLLKFTYPFGYEWQDEELQSCVFFKATLLHSVSPKELMVRLEKIEDYVGGEFCYNDIYNEFSLLETFDLKFDWQVLVYEDLEKWKSVLSPF